MIGDLQVPEPVGSSGESHAFTAVLGRVQFSNNRPDERTPGCSERSNKQAGEGDENSPGLGGVHRVLMIEREVSNEGVDADGLELAKVAHGLA